MDVQYNFAPVMLEAAYQIAKERVFAAGGILMREEFLNSPGTVVFTPRSLLQLWEHGIVEFLWVPVPGQQIKPRQLR